MFRLQEMLILSLIETLKCLFQNEKMLIFLSLIENVLEWEGIYARAREKEGRPTQRDSSPDFQRTRV